MAIRHRVGNHLLTWFTNCCYGSSLTDVETCYKLTHRTVLQQIETVSNSVDFEPEITAKILKRGIPNGMLLLMRHHFGLRTMAAAIVLAASLLSAAGCSGGASGPPVATVNLRLDRATVPIGGPLEMTFRFDVLPDLEPMTDDYTVFVHVLDRSGQQLWIDDHPPATPTSEWEPGQTIEYSRRSMVPLYPYIGEGDIAVGLYLPSTGERLTLAGDHIGQNAYRTASITFTPQHESSFLVYEEGWHGAEVQPNSQAYWHWTTGHALVSFQNPRGDARLMLEVAGRPDVFDTPQQFSLRIGEEVLEELSLDTSEPVIIDRTLTAAELGSDDVVRLELLVDQTFIPSELGVGDDARELGVRVLTVYVEPI